MEDARLKAKTRNITFKATVDEFTMDCHATQLQVLFSNLLSNAVSYSHDDGSVEVTLAGKGDGDPVLTIADHGIGIDPGKLSHIFKPYFRTKEAALHNPNSTGVGLALVNRIATTHGVRVSVESDPGEGTTFTLTFPSAECSEITRTRTSGRRHVAH